MPECKPERSVKRHGGEVWACKCGTLGVTFNGVTVRYSSKDFKRLANLMRLAEVDLLGAPAPAAVPATAGSGNLIH